MGLPESAVRVKVLEEPVRSLNYKIEEDIGVSVNEV
jgi:hypothetical protein